MTSQRQTKEQIAAWFNNLQNDICQTIAATDGKANFEIDSWTREGGGGGHTRILQNGHILEKAGVGFSAVHGETPDNILRALKLDKADFFATGVSIVMHPHSPLVPIIHMNIRYFEMTNGVWWFGGGIDLTPHYVVKEDATWFHEQLKQVCDKHNSEYYPKFKTWADDYFYIKHRQETRGIGGIFFDHLDDKTGEDKIGTSFEQRLAFVQDVGMSFAPIYAHFMTKNSVLPYTEAEKAWQLIRRGRYTEFNLVYDKGTKFGLDTNGRTESILMSLPPQANWLYNHVPQPNSKEEETLSLLKKGIQWA